MTRILITSALPYINGIKHLGNLVGSMLPADVYARFQRARENDVLFICATDEHGTPAELAARDAGMDVSEFCAEQHILQKDVGERFGLSWDFFGRSSSPQNKDLTQHFCKKLDEAGLIEERVDTQIYSIDDGRFLPDRYIVGTCPHCQYERARGDQCENCTRVLDSTDLINPQSAISGSTNLEVRESKQLYLRQSQMVDRLRTWIDGKSDWPNLVTSIAYKWLDEGLQDRCITRDLDWGIPVNRPGFEGKVFYVWFDAPIEYIGATREWADSQPADKRPDWKSWWYGEEAEEVQYVQFMAKDNIPFHTVGFPVTLFGSGEPWKSVDYIKGFNWLTYYGGKFSTSEKRGVFMDQALELLPADYWRYYLLANAPEGSDSSFTWDHFAGVINKDLADVLGNFVNRILRFTKSRFGETVPDGGSWGALERELVSDLEERKKQYEDYLEKMEFRKALAELRGIWARGNEYLTQAEPWVKFKQNKDEAAVGVRMGINLIHLFAHLAWPIIPQAASKLHVAVTGDSPEILPWPKKPLAEFLAFFSAGSPFQTPDVMFAKIEEDQVADWTEKFGGEAQ